MPEGQFKVAAGRITGLVLLPGRIARQKSTNRYNQISMSGENNTMSTFRRILTVSVLAMAAVAVASADTILSYSVNGGLPVQCVMTISSSPNVSADCGTINGSGATLTAWLDQGTQNTATGFSQLFSSTLQLTTTMPVDLTLWVTDQNFTSPVAPPAVSFLSSYSWTSTSGSGEVGFASCLDTSNGAEPPFCPNASYPNSQMLTRQ